MTERATHCDTHPIECEVINDDGETVCGWCEEVHTLTEDGKHLRDQLHKTAVLVAGGEVSIYGDIGYCVVYQGTVNMRNPDVQLELGQAEPIISAIAAKLSPDNLPSGG